MNQSNKVFLELLVNSGVSNFTKNQPNNFYNYAKTKEKNDESAEAIDLQSIDSIVKLKEYINNSNICPLKKTANKTVISDGSQSSRIIIIGEAPGRDEDIKGIPFVGQAGQLLNKMLTSINLQRKDVYITNVIPWRPPNNRTPTNNEIMQCLPFLQKQIEIIKPEFLLLLGATATRAILTTPLPISKLRNNWHTYSSINLDINIKTLVTYHPAFLLRSPQFKKEAWQDLKILQNEMILNEN